MSVTQVEASGSSFSPHVTSTTCRQCPEFYTHSLPVVLKSSLLPHQEHAVRWMQHREEIPGATHVGGILADDMGLGKTLDCIAVMTKSLESCYRHVGEDTPCTGLPMINLVVVPFSLLPQWKEEVLVHTDALESSVLLYHGPHRQSALCRFIDQGLGFIVITTYEVVRQEYSRISRDGIPVRSKKRGPKAMPSALFDHIWYRVILDEAHRIKTYSNITTKAVCHIQAKRRWCVTGTPFNNKIDDLVTLCRFIGITPYSSPHWWAINKADDKTVRSWVGTFMLNRTKDILELPVQTTSIVYVEFEKEEQAFYSMMFDEALGQYLRFKNMSGAKRFKVFGSVLSWLIRLRQVCNHPLLMLGRAWTRHYADQSSAGAFYAREICCRCKESADDIGYLRDLECGHYVCQSCMVMDDVRCDTCERLSFWLGEEVAVQYPDSCKTKYSLRSRRVPHTVRIRNYIPNSKCKAIVSLCAQKLEDSPTNKIVIFSQWTAFLDLLEYFLKRGEMEFLRYDGDILKAEDRDSVLKEFRKTTTHRIILCSLQCAGLGLNLVAANMAILADSYYNPFLEKQAIDRLHRIGQTRPVQVVRFIVNRSIEVDVARIQRKKMEMAENILSGMGMKGSNKEDSEGVDQVALDISEGDVHKIFRRASNTFMIRKNVLKRPHEDVKVGIQGPTIKRNAFDHFKVTS